MGTWSRFQTSLRAGIEAWSAYNQDALVPVTAHQWDVLSSRLFRYQHYRHYYFNTVYNSDHETYATQHIQKTNHGLYRHTRAIYNPVARGVDMYPAKVYGGQLDFEEPTAGAIPIKGLDPRQWEAIKQLWLWSDWQTNKSVYVQTGAMLGDCYINLVDEPSKGRVRMEVNIPDIFSDVDFDSAGNITACTIEYQRYDEHYTAYRYKEVITKEYFATFKNDEPYAYMEDASGQPVAKWPNIFGFVPIVHVRHKAVPGARFGMSATHKVLFKVDELNSSGSAMNDNVRNVNRPVWGAKGLSGDINMKVDDAKGRIAILKIPDNVDMQPLVLPLDLAAAGLNLDRMEDEIERDMPELALHRLREGGNLTAPGVRAGFSDAIDLIGEAMGYYDSGLVRAHKMAMTIGGVRGYQNFRGFDLNSFDRGDLEHQIGHREVIDDSLSKSEKVTFLVNVEAPKSLVFRELGYSEEEIQKAEEQQQAQQDQQFALEMAKANANRSNNILAVGAALQGQQNGNGTNGGQPQPGEQPGQQQPAALAAAASA